MWRYLNEWDSPAFRFVHGFGLGPSKSGSYTLDCDRRQDLDLVLENTGYRAQILPRLRKNSVFYIRVAYHCLIQQGVLEEGQNMDPGSKAPALDRPWT